MKKFKVELCPGTRLSEHHDNGHDCYKVVETDSVLGYVVLGSGYERGAAVYPLYRADVHVKVGSTWHIVASYEQGDRLNDYTFHADYEGCTFAAIAAQAIGALEERRRAPQGAKPSKGAKPVKAKESRGGRRR